MPRVAPAPVEQFAPLFGENAPLRLQVYAQRPELAEAFVAFGATLRKERLLSDRLIELVRLRVAFWNQCRSCMAIRYEEGTKDGLTEALVCSLERPEDAPDLTDAERAAIAYADLFATDHLAIGDDTFDRLREHFSDAEIMELCMNVALFVGFGRMGAVLHMVEDLPDRFQGDGRITPWGEGDVVRVADWATAGAA
jgi:AhpD family alkylhydroperoxidase